MSVCVCNVVLIFVIICFRYFFFFQAEDGIRDLVRSRGLGDVYKRQRDDDAVQREPRPGARGHAAAGVGEQDHARVAQDLSLIHI